MGRKTSDTARQHCTGINNNPNHLRCKYCGHKMWGITRFKKHLAHKRGDVMPCGACPREVTVEMTEELLQLSLRKEEKERRIQEESQSMIRSTITSSQSNVQERLAAATTATAPSNVQERPAAAAETEAELAAKEKYLMEEAIKESLKCFEMEKSKSVRNDDDEFEAALRESMKSYRVECWRRGESSSRSRGEARLSSYGNNYLFKPDSDSDSDFGF